MRDTHLLNESFNTLVQKKKVLFITTKNVDYIRNTQEINLLEKSAQLVKVLGYKDKSYVVRLIKIYTSLLLMSLKDFNLIFVGFAPQLILPLFYFKFKGKFIVEDFFISLYDTMINDRKKFKPSSLFAKIFLWLDKITIKRSDSIIVDTVAHGAYFSSDLGADKDKINVLYLEADPKIYYPMCIPKEGQNKNKFRVLYFGSILPLQGIDIILECIEKMENETSIFFEIIGPIKSIEKDKYSQLKNVTFVSWLSQKALAKEIASADLCLAGHFNKNILKASRTIPGKAYIYDAMQKQMILGDNAANHELFDQDNIKYHYVEMGNSDKLKEKILSVASKNKEGARVE